MCTLTSELKHEPCNNPYQRFMLGYFIDDDFTYAFFIGIFKEPLEKVSMERSHFSAKLRLIKSSLRNI